MAIKKGNSNKKPMILFWGVVMVDTSGKRISLNIPKKIRVQIADIIVKKGYPVLAR